MERIFVRLQLTSSKVAKPHNVELCHYMSLLVFPLNSDLGGLCDRSGHSWAHIWRSQRHFLVSEKRCFLQDAICLFALGRLAHLHNSF